MPRLKNPVDQSVHDAACAYRLRRVREQLALAGCDAILLYDPVNIRYATDTSNMAVWTMHNAARYALVCVQGPVLLWEFHNCAHLHDGNKQVDEIRDAINWSHFGAGGRATERAAVWADELGAELRRHCETRPALAVDTAPHHGLQLLEDSGVDIRDGESIMETARMIKSEDELELMRWTMRVCEAGVQRMYDELRPGTSEQELWSWLHYENVRHGGEWIETRLLSSGPRTNPWMQEVSDRIMQEGELVCFDTDLIGPYGYCADISRTWTVAHCPPTARQRELYRYAFEQLEVNSELLKPGASYREISERAWPIPARFYANRYSFLMHGVGMGDEFPGIVHWGEDWDATGSDGIIEPNMVISVESYIGEAGGDQGVKLEQQFIVDDARARPMTDRFWNEDWL